MKLITGQTHIQTEGASAITLGKFDGIHLGHQKLIRELLRAGEEGLKTVVFTFLRPPKTITEGTAQPVLLTQREKRLHMEKLGIDLMVEFPFTEEVCHMEPEIFIEQVMVNGLHVKKVITGPDFCFGYRRRGTVSMLKEYGERFGYEVIVIEKARAADGEIISSSLVRREIAAGQIERAGELLGYPYTVTGEVVHGNHLGRTFGMPTINQIPAEEKLLPPNGVYAARMEIDGIRYDGVSNVGYKPTIAGKYPKGVETYLFGFKKDVYGRTLDVMLYHYQRPEQKFDSVARLKEQLARDAEKSRKYFADHPGLE